MKEDLSGAGMRNKQIEELLVESELEDFLPSDDEICDPEYQPGDEPCSSSEKSSSEESDEIQQAVERRGTSRRGRGRGWGNCGGRGSGSGLGTDNDGQLEGDYDVEPSSSSPTSSQNNSNNSSTRFSELVQPAYLPADTTGFDKIDYLYQYIDHELINLIVTTTNRTYERNGRNLLLTAEELCVYLGITLVMATIDYPNIRMYWEKKWRVAVVADNMARNRFLALRNSLKAVFDPDITTETKNKDRIWKIRPLFDRIVAGCRKQPKDQCLSVDEMIIRFTGSCSIKQFSPGKNMVGIKAFVLANPDGTICDMHIYSGQTTYANEDTDFGLRQAVITLTEYLVPGHVLYFDRYTSEKLLDELEQRGIRVVMKNRISVNARSLFISDKKMKTGRESSQVVRNGEKGFDYKPVNLGSSSDVPDSCRRWCEKTKTYVNIPRPTREYNSKMGVNLADRLLSVCPYRYKTRKWTQRCFAALIDLAVCNSWLQYKKDQLASSVPVKKIPQLRCFKMDLGEILIQSYSHSEPASEHDQEPKIKRKRGRTALVPEPSKQFRNSGAKHLPYLVENVGRCRHCHHNRTQFKCRACNVSLCLTKTRNCFVDFHDS
ncbi:piggyBac transposable element-derived protein 2-like [Cydia fagiglandana]|uniref:piggyBac transposable element-derived protein 2-like n=1 Tax=Cydia fagiglandana TaxID=1458189 RepID=UPI002FEE4C63